MGNKKSLIRTQSSNGTYNKVADHLRDLSFELFKLNQNIEEQFFLEIINALVSLIYDILTKETAFSSKNVPLERNINYNKNLLVVKRCPDFKSLLGSCCIKSTEQGIFANTDEYSYHLRSLLTIYKYCSLQKLQIITLPIDGMDPSSIFQNQIEDFFIANMDKFPSTHKSSITNLNLDPSNSQPNGTTNSISILSNPHDSSPITTSNIDSTPVTTSNILTSASTTRFNFDGSIPKRRNAKRTIGSRRLESERKLLLSNQNEGIRLIQEQGKVWIIEIDGAENTLYENETYTLRFTFDDNYPIESPEVIFVNTPPTHPHIYSNGSICLSILYDGWSPALGVVPICLSLISMLSSCKKKIKPEDDAFYSQMKNVKPKDTLWYFHDEKV